MLNEEHFQKSKTWAGLRLAQALLTLSTSNMGSLLAPLNVIALEQNENKATIGARFAFYF